jgi:N-acetylglucosaminyldiphosphoundecaprenol N-acetyl-beta-D-mannosaminyltransferase
VVPPSTLRILGIDYFVGDLDSAAEAVIARARSGHGGYACLTGVHGTVLAQHDARLKRALTSAWRNFPDGAPIAWLERRIGRKAARRVAGPDLMPLVIERGVDWGIRHFFFGSTEHTLRNLERTVMARAPGALVVGSLSPPFREQVGAEDDEIIERVRAAAADIVWVGLGTPKQDLWLRANAERLAPALGVGVGAAFDFVAGDLRRAPLWMRHAGLEWLHRATTSSLWGRYLRVNSEFVGLALVVIWQGRASKSLGTSSERG